MEPRMIDETEVEDAEDEYDDTPEQTEVMAGTFVIFDTDAFRSALNCLAIQVTDEGGVYVLDATTHMLRALEIDTGKPKGKLARIQ